MNRRTALIAAAVVAGLLLIALVAWPGNSDAARAKPAQVTVAVIPATCKVDVPDRDWNVYNNMRHATTIRVHTVLDGIDAGTYGVKMPAKSSTMVGLQANESGTLVITNRGGTILDAVVPGPC